MQIAFAARSRFKAPIGKVLSDQREALEAGELITVILGDLPEGYPGQVTVDLSSEWQSSFVSDWRGGDPSRFPARLKAAATVISEMGAHGRFVLTHRAGTLTIQRLANG